MIHITSAQAACKGLQLKTRQDKTRQDKTRQDKTRQDKTRQDKTIDHRPYRAKATMAIAIVESVPPNSQGTHVPRHVQSMT